jgi:hypothetical protein
MVESSNQILHFTKHKMIIHSFGKYFIVHGASIYKLAESYLPSVINALAST